MSYYNSGNRIQKESPVVFYTIAVNVVVFLAQTFVPQLNITDWGSLHYFKSDEFRPHQIITNMFLHGSWGHLFFNMFALYIFGSVLERFWGSKRFFNFYMICGIGSAILVQFTIPFSAEQYAKSTEVIGEMGGYSKEVVNMYLQQYSALGASGAIMGVMAAFAYLFPNTELMIMFIPIPVKAKYVIPVYVLLDLFGGFYRIAGDNIGHFAHLGGALIGFLLVLFWNKNNRKTFY